MRYLYMNQPVIIMEEDAGFVRIQYERKNWGTFWIYKDYLKEIKGEPYKPWNKVNQTSCNNILNHEDDGVVYEKINKETKFDCGGISRIETSVIHSRKLDLSKNTIIDF